MIAELRALETSKAPNVWLEVAAYYPRVTEATRLPFIKALRRVNAVKSAQAALAADASTDADKIAALVVLRVMKPENVSLERAFASSVAVRREATIAAAVLPPNASLRASLLTALADPDHLVRDFAISALKRQGLDGEAKARMQERLSVEDDEQVRTDLMFALN